MIHRKPVFYRVPIFLIALLICAASLAATDVSESATMSAEGRVSVTNVAGKVTVQGWDRSEVVLSGTISDNVERVDFDADGRNVTIEVIYRDRGERGDRGWDWGRRDQDAQLELRVPTGSHLEIDTTSADIEVADHMGAQDIRSVSGNIDIVLGQSEVNLKSISGDIDARGLDVAIEAQLESVSGDVDLDGFRGDLEVETVSGDIDIRNAVIRDGEFEAVSGDMDLQVRLGANGRLDMESVSGDVGIEFDGPVDANIQVNSHSGDIDKFFGVAAERTSRYGPGRRLRASVGNGSADVNISTLSGDVRNRTRD